MNITQHFRSLMLTRFLEEISCGGEVPRFVCAVKRLSGNDTGLTGGHQAGLYLPRTFFERALPTICTSEIHNPDAWIDECYVVSHDVTLRDRLRAIYYNSKVCRLKGCPKNGRNEFRITRWGGKDNPLQQEKNTGGLVVFGIANDGGSYKAVAWLAQTEAEETLIEDWVGGEIEGGEVVLKDGAVSVIEDSSVSYIPEEWIRGAEFPKPQDIFDHVVSTLPFPTSGADIDKLLMQRRELEFNLFQLVEKKRLEPWLQKGGSIPLETFHKLALSMQNRRKSRSGKSLELHLASIFEASNIQFECQVKTEGNKRPDFIFPSGEAYHNIQFPIEKLTMMAAKTTCKDRWRQILNEADRFRDQKKYLFTLQEGISSQQMDEMHEEQVVLVVPRRNLGYFKQASQGFLMDLTGFVDTVRQQQAI